MKGRKKREKHSGKRKAGVHRQEAGESLAALRTEQVFVSLFRETQDRVTRGLDLMTGTRKALTHCSEPNAVAELGLRGSTLT